MAPTGPGGRERRPVFAGLVEHGLWWSPLVRLLSIEQALLAAILVLRLTSSSSDGQGYFQAGVDKFGRQRYRCDVCKEERSWLVPPPPEERKCSGCTPPEVLQPVQGN
jgi:hypothetical protein